MKIDQLFQSLGETFVKATVTPPGQQFSWPTFIGGVVTALLATWVF